MPSDDIPRQQATADLRKLIKFLSLNRITYAMLAGKMPKEHKWTANGIKQLVRKDGAMRINAKNISLASQVYFDVLNLVPFELRDHELNESLKSVYQLVGNSEQETRVLSQKMTSQIGTRFQSLRQASASHEFPRTLAFVRFDWNQKRMIVIRVESRASQKGYSFTMKIEGRNQNRRIIIGDILYTQHNTYYSGLAYDVLRSTGEREFFDVNPSDYDAIRKMVIPNEIGLECFTISSQTLGREEIPVSFHGLDGRGNPTSGVGLVIHQDQLAAYRISENDSNTAFTPNENPKLFKALEAVGALTVSPRLFNKENDPILPL